MQKRTSSILLGLGLALVFVTLNALGHGNEHAKTEAVIGNAKVSIEYARPTLKGRDINTLIQPGQMWRLGADVPTVIESDTDLDFGGTVVPKGKHVLLARLIAPGQWSLVVSSQPIYSYEPSAKLAEVPLKLEQMKDPVEAMAIQLSNEAGQGIIQITWGTQKLTASFKPAS
jgi:Protein of unknown function (DUF2911)